MTRDRAIVFALLFLAIGFYCLDYFFRISPSLVLQQLMTQYHTGPLGMGLFASSFYLGYVIFQIPGGYLLDRYPIKFPIAIIILLCTACFIGFIFSKLFWLGCVLRFLIGATSAISFIGVLYVARRYYPSAWLPFISGVTVAIGTLMASFVETITAFSMKWIPWQATLTGFSAWGVIIALLILVLPICGVKSETDLTPPERHLFANILTLFKNWRLLFNGLIGGLFYLPTSLLTAVWGISFLKASYGLSETSASSGIFLIFLGWAIGSPLMGLIGGRLQGTRLLVALPALCAACVSLILLHDLETDAHTLAFICCFLFGLFSSAQVLVWKNFNEACPTELTGLGIAVTNMTIMLIVTVAHSLIANLINNTYQLHQLNPLNYLNGLSWIPWIFVSVAVLTTLNKPKK